MSASTFVRLMLNAAAAASAAAATSAEEGAARDLGHPLAQPDELRADRDELGRWTRGGEEGVGDRRCTLCPLGLAWTGERVGGGDLVDEAGVGLGQTQCRLAHASGARDDTPPETRHERTTGHHRPAVPHPAPG